MIRGRPTAILPPQIRVQGGAGGLPSFFGLRCDHAGREYIANQAGEIIAWSCNSCAATGNSDLVALAPARRECEWCGDGYDPARDNWFHRRYCSRRCYWEDLDERRIEGRPLTDQDNRGRRIEP